jgi:hypothetical protein
MFYLFIRSIFTAHTFNSGIFDIGSRAVLVSMLADASLKWKGIKTTPFDGRSEMDT